MVNYCAVKYVSYLGHIQMQQCYVEGYKLRGHISCATLTVNHNLLGFIQCLLVITELCPLARTDTDLIVTTHVDLAELCA